MKRPSFNDFERAVFWLDCNEGRDGESEACAAVADWIRAYAAAAEIRAAARNSGCSVKHIRKALLAAACLPDEPVPTAFRMGP